MANIENMIGRKFVSVDVIRDHATKPDKITFTQATGSRFIMHHEQDCCESVYIEDICGNVNDLVGAPILIAEMRERKDQDAYESGTWSFYEFATNKGSVTIRWYGESNGYYSESVDIDFEDVLLDTLDNFTVCYLEKAARCVGLVNDFDSSLFSEASVKQAIADCRSFLENFTPGNGKQYSDYYQALNFYNVRNGLSVYGDFPFTEAAKQYGPFTLELRGSKCGNE